MQSDTTSTTDHEPNPVTLVIFGASGDLAHRSLWPSLYNLQADGHLPKRFRVVGVAFDINEATFAEEMAEAVNQHSRSGFDRSIWDQLAKNIRLLRGGFGDRALYQQLAELLDHAGEEIGSREVVFYLAVAPQFVATIADGLDSIGYGNERAADVRLVAEKPFGHDLQSAITLNNELHEHFTESQIFRMDHYLGKETVQNLLVLRFANGIFEPLFNRNFVDSIQITVAEPEGVGSRASYYDHSGALRDVLQNHMMQLVSYIAMEPPQDFAPERIQIEKAKVLLSATIPDPLDGVVRGQYSSGPAGIGYLEEADIPADSMTETYIGARLAVNNWRWSGVPFYLRTGKRLPSKMAEIVVRFKPIPHLAFGAQQSAIHANDLIITLQPDEGVRLQTMAKVPGTAFRLQEVEMDFAYSSSFQSQSPQAYERLLHDAMLGDSTLFMHAEEVEAAWRIVQPVLDHWTQTRVPPFAYPAGSAGPEQAQQIIIGERGWRQIAAEK
jgi:glucose-6-phosphate 1-dehydrogenase